jgi:hypothetical protein
VLVSILLAVSDADCPHGNGDCGYDAGYSTAETVALIVFALLALAVIGAIVWLIRLWRAGRRS